MAYRTGNPNPRLLAGLLLGLLAASASAQPAPATLVLVGPAGESKILSAAELAALPQVEVVSLEKDSSRVVFRGPTLRSLVTLVGAPDGHDLRGKNMLLAILADASDGYQAGYMLAEVDEQFGARKAIVALTQDGRALPASDGPFRVVVGGEEHRARWIRQLIRLRVVRLRE